MVEISPTPQTPADNGHVEQGERCHRDGYIDGSENRSAGNSVAHTTSQTGGWNCRECLLKICTNCAGNEVYSRGEIEATLLYTTNTTDE